MTRRWLVAILLPAALGMLGASGPEVVRVRVPVDKVPAWFPAGSELRVLPWDEFEALARAARNRPEPPRPPRILRASHRARWQSGLLAGTTALTVETTEASPGWMALEPWSPALTGQGAGASLARTSDDGLLGLRIDARSAAAAVELGWQLRSRPGSDGRVFAVGLPDVDISALELDLPEDLEPEGNLGTRTGPEPGEPGRAVWRFASARGRFELRIRPRGGAEPGDDASRPRIWLSGTTRVDLAEASANWRADWTIDPAQGAARTVTIELDPGLELVDVSGPRVASFRTNEEGQKSRVEIRLEAEAAGPSPLTLRGICRAPAEGVWSIPSARPVDATWLGGRTRVRLGPSRVLQSCLERAGRRVVPRGDDGPGASTLVFEPDGAAGPVADLTFRAPGMDATVDIRGRLRLGDGIPRVEVRTTWTPERGRVLACALDLPPGWRADRAETAAGQQVSWHAEPLGGGRTRVHLSPPALDDNGRPFTLVLVAHALEAGVVGPIDLPRIRPPASAARVIDEVWVAPSDPELSLRPILASGLAWIDPPGSGPNGTPGPDDRGLLAWRWLSEDAEARVDRTLVAPTPRGEIRLVATIGREWVHLDWTLTVEARPGTLRAIPIHLDSWDGEAPRWRSDEPGVGPVAVVPLDPARRSALGLPGGGSAWALEPAGPARGVITLRGSADRPWTGVGRIPLLTLPGSFRARGRVAVDVDAQTRAAVEAPGLTVLDRVEAVAIDETATTRRATTLAYRPGAGPLRVETDRGQPSPSGALIREATLVSQTFPGSGWSHQLTLRVSADGGKGIDLTFPPGLAIERLRRDGAAIAPEPSGRSLRVPIPSPSASRPWCQVVIDYRTAAGTSLAGRSVLPGCSIPCLSFVWEVAAPEGWRAVSDGPGLVASEPLGEESWARGLIGLGWPSWPVGRTSAAAASATLLELDRRFVSRVAPEATLGDWMLELDSGRSSVVIDRLALAEAGLGPRTVVTAPQPRTGLADALATLGLVVIPLREGVLITSRLEERARTGSTGWEAATREAVARGSDASDRFQTAGRWRGELTPRALAPGESADRADHRLDGSRSRFVAADWPAETASISIRDERAGTAWSWLVAATVLVAGVALRRRSRWIHGAILAAGGLATAVALAWSGAEPSSVVVGLARGLLATAAFWWGVALRPVTRSAEADSGETARPGRRSGLFERVVFGLLLLAGSVQGTTLAAPPAEPERPILALLPFEGVPDPLAKPDRVILLLSDYERLLRASQPEPTPSSARAWLVDVTHKVSRDRPGMATVESAFALEVIGEGPATWTLPVGPALELAATLDGQPAPLAIASDGRSARVTLNGAGNHELVFRRDVAVTAANPREERIRLPIHRAARARGTIEATPKRPAIAVVGALGAIEPTGDRVAGWLGPIEALEVRWTSSEPGPPVKTGRSIEGILLWDAQPAGDLVRARFLHAEPEPVSAIRLALGPGVLVRSHAIPGVVGVRLEGTPERPEWVAHVDPPLPRDFAIAVEVWKPAAPGAFDRRLPRVEPVGASRYAGVVGFRRPSDWSGRLEPGEAEERRPEASFVQAWGALPDDGLTLAGAVQFSEPPDLAVATGPLVRRRASRTAVRLDLSPGRVDAEIETTLIDRQGRSFDVESVLPREFRILSVRSPGLVDWFRVGRDRVRLQFDGTGAAERVVTIRGCVAVPSSSVMNDAAPFQARIPWPAWVESDAEPGTLSINSPTHPSFEPGPGVTAAPLSAVSAASPNFETYRVDRPEGLAPLQWSAPRARAAVSVQSDLAIDAASVVWTAVIRCDVSGGPAESFLWTLPADWAAAAKLEGDGVAFRLDARTTGGTTRWTVVPDPPCWGQARFILRATRPLVIGRPLPFPELATLATQGRGTVDRYDLAIANASGLPLEVATSTGLQEVDASTYRSAESPTSPGSFDRAYRVTGSRWSLRLRVGREGESHRRNGLRPTRASAMEASVALGDDGTLTGRATIDLKPNPGPFLELGLPELADIPWAAVDRDRVPAVLDGPGRWRIPLANREARTVSLIWHDPGTPSRWAVTPPSLGQEGVPTLLRVETPASLQSAELPASWSRIDGLAWEVETAERIARRVVREVSDSDRSTETPAGLVEGLVAFETSARRVGRINATPRGLQEAVGRVEAARASITDACELAGLDDLIETARARVGIDPPPTDASSLPLDRDPGPRPRRIGSSWLHQGVSQAEPGEATLTWTPRPTARRWLTRGFWLTLGLGLLATLTAATLVTRPIRLPWRVRLGLLAVGVVGMAVVTPVGMAGAVVLVGLGRARD